MVIRKRACKLVFVENGTLSTKNIFQLNFFQSDLTSQSNFALKTNGVFLFLPNHCNVTECDSRIPQNRLPSEEQKLMHRAFCISMKRLLIIAYSVNINLSIGLVLKALSVSSRKYLPSTVPSKVRNLRKV